MTGPPIRRLTVSACRIPTDRPESDGTLAWSATTIVIVEVDAGGRTGLGFTYADLATARFIDEHLAELVVGRDALAVTGAWSAMRQAVRNLGRPGVTSMALAAVDIALWDLKARLLDLPLATLLGQVRRDVAAYGSGGFTSASRRELMADAERWVQQGLGLVKMKVGRRPGDDEARVRAMRGALPADVVLFVDANGAYSRKQALGLAERFAALGVAWFEEPVSSDDLAGLRLLRDRAPAGMDIAAGEYGYDLFHFQRLLDAGAVDVLQADVTRCGGVTELLRVAALCEAAALPLSTHTAPSLHVHPGCALTPVCHLEYFHDHARIEHALFDGAAAPVRGALAPDLSRAGLGLELKRRDAARFAA
jgi:L-alanine-DL-glutamate epimerase-like enolase superfamily enzyme